MSLTPAKLRACQASATRNHSWAPIMVQDCPMLADAMEIADSSARADIECQCLGAGKDQIGNWWDTSTADAESKPMIEQSMRYLEARGLLIRKEGAPHIVTFRDPQ